MYLGPGVPSAHSSVAHTGGIGGVAPLRLPVFGGCAQLPWGPWVEYLGADQPGGTKE